MAVPVAGNRITANLLAQIPLNVIRFITGQCTSSTDAKTAGAANTFIDVTGTSVTFSVAFACTIKISASFDCNFAANADIGVTGAILVGRINVDGVDQAGQTEFNGQNASNAEFWTVNLSAGSHTIKMRTGYIGPTPGSPIKVLASHSRWIAEVPSP